MGAQRGAAGSNDMNYTFEQFYVSTAEDESNYFTKVPGDAGVPSLPSNPLPPGTYRVLAGQLYRIVPGVPPNFDEALNRADESKW